MSLTQMKAKKYLKIVSPSAQRLEIFGEMQVR